MYCGDAWKKSLLGTFLFIGGILGTAVFSVVANTYGRKKACVLSFLLGSLGGVLLSFAPNYWYALGLYLMTGLVLPYYNFGSLLLTESGDGNFRTFATGMFLVA